ncbi:MAG: hypothetical protein ACR2M3_12335 [Thermomicrobiales bacterium]
METVDGRADATLRLRVALGFGAFLWLFLLLVGFVAPGGWHWGWQGSIGHMINYMIALWFVALVAAPLLAMLDPLHSTTVIQLYFLGMVGVMLSSIRSEHPEILSDGVPLIVALLAIGIVLWVHPHRSRLWRLA